MWLPMNPAAPVRRTFMGEPRGWGPPRSPSLAGPWRRMDPGHRVSSADSAGSTPRPVRCVLIAAEARSGISTCPGSNSSAALPRRRRRHRRHRLRPRPSAHRQRRPGPRRRARRGAPGPSPGDRLLDPDLRRPGPRTGRRPARTRPGAGGRLCGAACLVGSILLKPAHSTRPGSSVRSSTRTCSLPTCCAAAGRMQRSGGARSC